jgi:hypothetical protein
MANNEFLGPVADVIGFTCIKMSLVLETFCIQNGISQPFELIAIRAGRNSAVYRVSCLRDQLILKHYFSHDADKRNRLFSEYQFLTFLNEVGSQLVAKPIACDYKNQVALYSFLEGSKPLIVSDFYIDQAVQFLLTLNRLKHDPKARNIGNASDACFNLEQHINLVRTRFLQFESIRPVITEAKEVLGWIKDVLAPCWEKIGSQIPIFQEKLTTYENILSPSYFGFHNALDFKGKLSFVDFEYAGWDSMAKLACDFICQPELPISKLQATNFLKELANQTYNKDLVYQVETLLPVHRIKWCFILLNVFNDVHLQRRFHSGNLSQDILTVQFNKAKYYFEKYLQNS